MGGNNGLNYNSPSYLMNQQMHLTGDQSAGQQTGGAGAGQRSMKSNAGGASSQKYNNPLWQWGDRARLWRDLKFINI